MTSSILKPFLILILFFSIPYNHLLKAQSLDPPTNATAIQEGASIRLNWDAPIAEGLNRPTLSWNTSDLDTVGRSIATVYPIFVGCRFDFSDFHLQDHVGRKVKSVDLYADNPNDSCTFKLQIFRCTTWSNYNIYKVYEQPFSISGTGHPTTVEVASDFYITPDFIFYTFGYELINPNSEAVNVFGMDEGPHVYRRGDMVHTPNHYGGGWQSLSEVGSLFGINVDANFIIKVTLSEKYNVYRDGELLATVYEPTFLDTTAQPNQSYCYTIKTVYLNSLSDASNETCCTREVSFSAPEQFNYSISLCQLSLNWPSIHEEESDGTFSEYRIYKNDMLIGNTTDTSFIDENPSVGNCNYCICATYLYNSQLYESERICRPIMISVPEIVIVGDSSICQNSDATLTAYSTETNFLWNTGSTENTITVSPVSTTTYFATTFNSIGCWYTDSFTVQVFENPNIVITSDSSICFGESITLNAFGGVAYYWNTGDSTSSITVSPSSTTTYSVTVFNEWNCSSSASVTISVHTPPALSITPDTSICYNDHVTLVAEGEGTVIWDNGMTGNQIVVAPTETTTYTATLTNGFHCSSIDSVTVFVHPRPEVSILGDTVLCYNDTTTLKATGGTSYLWNNGITNDSITICPTETTMYSVTATNEFYCSSTKWITVVVHPPLDISISGDSTLCQGTETTLTASGGITYLWADGSTTPSITVTPTETVTYQVIAYDEFGCENMQNFTVQVLATPDVSITGDTSICFGETTTLTAQGDYLFQWNDGSQESAISVAPSQTTTYAVLATGENQCSSIATTIVYVHDFPIISITGNDSICIGESTTLTSSGADFYLWDDGSTENPITVSPTQSTTYHVVGSNLFGCSSSQEFHVFIQPLPIAQYIISGNSEVCKESEQDYSIYIEHAESYTWIVPEGVIIEEGQEDFSISTFISDSAQSGEIMVYGTNECGSSDTVSMMLNVSSCSINISGTFQVCAQSIHTYSVPNNHDNYIWGISGGEIISGEGTSTIEVLWGNSGSGMVTIDYEGASETSREVTIFELPFIIFSGNSDICLGDTTILTVSGGVDYLWSDGSFSPEITVFPDSTTSYAVTATNAYGCYTTDSMSVIVNPLPDIFIDGTDMICTGDSTLLTAVSSHEITNYLWNTGQDASSLIIAPIETTTYSVSVTDNHGCQSSSEKTIVVNALPDIEIDGDNEICFGSSSLLTAQASVTGTFSWSNGDATQSISVMPLETTSYSVIFTDENGCSNSTETIVIVHSLPEIEINGDEEICLGESTELTANVFGSLPITYLWNTGDSTPNIIITPQTSTEYSITVTDENGCSNDQSFVVEITTIDMPGDFSVSGFSDHIQLLWSATADAEEYYIYRDSQHIATTSNLLYNDFDIVPQVQYCYQLSAKNYLCESDLTEESCASSIQNEEFQHDRYSIHPNPAHDYFIIQGNSITRIDMVNTLGQLILSQKCGSVSKVRMTTQSLESGLFFIRLYHSDGTIEIKQIIIIK